MPEHGLPKHGLPERGLPKHGLHEFGLPKLGQPERGKFRKGWFLCFSNTCSHAMKYLFWSNSYWKPISVLDKMQGIMHK